GTAVVNLIQTAPDELVTAASALLAFDEHDAFVMITKQGVIKKTAVSAYANIRSNGLIAIKLDEGDELKWVPRSRPGDEVMIITHEGQSIRFKESDARPLGRSTRGVRAIKLRPKDVVVGADVAAQGKPMNLIVLSENGQGKQTMLAQYTLQHRGGVGIKTMQITPKTGKIVGASLVERGIQTEVIVTSTSGQIIRLPLKGVPTLGRATQGVRIMRMKPGDRVASFTLLLVDKTDEHQGNPDAEVLSLPTVPEPPATRSEKRPAERATNRPKSAIIAKRSEPKVKTAGFTRHKLAAKAAPKAKPRLATRLAAKPKAVVRAGFAMRKLTKLATPKAKSRTIAKRQTNKNNSKNRGFTRRKLR
ncbi:MAG: DNA gyrase C-terminal beta-propeller domain-containing protein, partial [bacterium]